MVYYTYSEEKPHNQNKTLQEAGREKNMEMRNNLQKYVSNLGIGISVEQLVKNIYKFLSMVRGSDNGICIVNDRYLEIDGTTFQFIRKKSTEAWVVKVIK
jgi:hypothetical protein